MRGQSSAGHMQCMSMGFSPMRCGNRPLGTSRCCRSAGFCRSLSSVVSWSVDRAVLRREALRRQRSLHPDLVRARLSGVQLDAERRWAVEIFRLRRGPVCPGGPVSGGTPLEDREAHQAGEIGGRDRALGTQGMILATMTSGESKTPGV